MFEAQILIATADPYSVYSPWFTRGGTNSTIELEVLQVGGSPTIDAELCTKEEHAAGDGTGVGNAASVTGAGSDQTSQDGVLKELVRYKFTITGNDAGDWALFRMMPIRWFEDVGA